MPFFYLLILALVQGLTEFLPVSSSGHLVLTHHLFGEGTTDLCWEQDKTMDIAVHAGTLFSVLLYYRRDLADMLTGLFDLQSAGFHKIKHMLIGSVPVIAAGLALHVLEPSVLCLVSVMAWTTLIFGIILWIADRFFPADKTIEDMRWHDSLLIGLAQCLALVPGTSRSGITMTAGRMLGFSRTDSAHFALLLSIVAIAGAGTLTGLDLVKNGNFALGTDALMAMGLSFVSGYAAITLMMAWLKRSGFAPFAIYRILMGAGLLALIYSGLL